MPLAHNGGRRQRSAVPGSVSVRSQTFLCISRSSLAENTKEFIADSSTSVIIYRAKEKNKTADFRAGKEQSAEETSGA
jgi:CRISPR/Cas system-associated endoribonuclease Cas2